MELNWIEWNGGECPVPAGHEVSVKYRDGEVRRDNSPDNWCWHHHEGVMNIAAYFDHTAAEQEEPKEWKDGLPPVGVECEFSYTCKSGVFSPFWKGELLGENNGMLWFRVGTTYLSEPRDRVKIRPIKSQAEKEREEFIKEATKVLRDEAEKYGDVITRNWTVETIYDWLIESGMAKRLADNADS